MKKLSVLSVLILWSYSCFSQSAVYHPLPVSWAGWEEQSRGYQSGDCKDWDYWITGDTTFDDGLIYHKLQSRGIEYWMGTYGCTTTITSHFNYYAGAFRNDSIHRKVYFRQAGHSRDTLLYDFDLQLGQELPGSFIYNPQVHHAYVLAIDSVLIGDDYHKRFQIFDATAYHYTDLIEGIGSAMGLLEIIFEPFEHYTALLCFEHNGIALFPTKSKGGCGIYTGDNYKEENVIKTQMYPNPVTDNSRLYIEDAEFSQNFGLKVYNIFGENCLSQKVTSGTVLKLGFLPQGLYIFTVTDFNGRVFHGKFLKQE